MANVDPKITRTITWIAGIIAIVVAAALPALYFALSYRSTVADLTTEAEINARLASTVINANPEMWRFQQLKLEEFLSRRPRRGHPEVRRILDNDSRVITESVDALETPLITESADFRDAGLTVGRIEISRSLRPLITQTGGVALLGLLLGWVAFFSLRVLPLRALGDAMADNVRLYEETHRQLTRVQALHEIDLAITSSLDLHSVLDVLLEKTERLIPLIAAATVRLLNRKTGELEPVACRNLNEEEWKAETKVASEGGVASMFPEGNAPVMILDSQSDPRSLASEFLRKNGLVSYLRVPLVARNETLGVITFFTKEEHSFASEEVEFLNTLAGQAAIAIHNSQLYKETEHRAREQAVLNAIAMATSKALHIDDLLQIALDKVLEITGRERGSIRLKDPVTEEITLAAHRGLSKEELEGLARTVSHQATDQVFATGQPVVIQDGPEARQSSPLLAQSRSVAWIPIIAGTNVAGVLCVSTTRLAPFVQREVDLLQAIGSVIGVALENARLFEETEHRARELAALHAVSAAVSGSFDIEQILLKGLDAVLEVTGMDGGYIQFLDGNPPSLVLRAHRGMSQSFIAKTRDEIRPGGKTRQLIETKQPLVMENISSDQGGQFQDEKITVAVWAPIMSKDKVIAILAVSTKTKRTFSQAQLPLLRSIGNALGLALENARLFKETERSLERIRALRDIDQAISSTLDLRNVLDILLEKIDLSLPYASATIRLLNKDTGLLDPIACRNLDEQEWKVSQWRGGRGIANIVFETKAPLIIPNAQVDARVLDREFYRKHKLISYVGVPLIVKDESLGVLGFYTKVEHEFTGEEVEFLSTLAGQAAIAIHNSQLYEETEHRRREAEELARVAQSLTETLDMTAVGERIVTSVRELFGVKTAILRLLQPDGSLRPLALSGETFLQDSTAGVISDGMGIVSQAVAEGRSIWSRDVLNDPKIRLSDEMRDYQLQSGNRSMIAVPLHAHERVIGSLGLSDQTGRVYSKSEIALLQTFADQAALALENARLYNETRTREAELKETNRMLSALHAVAAAASQSVDLDRVLRAAIEKITDIFSFDATQIHIYNERTDELLLGAFFESTPNRFASVQSFRRGQGIVGKVAESGKPLIFEDVPSDPSYPQLSRSKISGQLAYRFFAVFPIKGKLKNLGTLACSGVDARKLNPGEIQLIEALADQIAIAIENSGLYDQLRQKVEELQQANKVKDEFLSVMSHELRTPLNIVMGYTAMIKDEMLGSVNTEQRKALEKVITRSNDLLSMITSILHATSIEAKEVRVQSTRFALPDLLDELKRVYEVSLSKSITLNWDYPSDMPLLILDREKVRVVLQKIIDNAVKFTERGRIAISARIKEGGRRAPPKGFQPKGEADQPRAEADQPPPQCIPPEADQEDRAETGKSENGEESLWPHAFLEVKVDDTGVGITKEKLPVIFEKFRQADSSETRRFGGVGLGLYIAKHFTELMGGKIEVDTEEGKGSIFTVRVPCLLSSPEEANRIGETQERLYAIEQIN